MLTRQAEISKAKSWCFRNGIRIYPHPLDAKGTRLKIIVEKRGKQKLGNKVYDNESIYNEMNDLYVYYFEKNTNKTQKMSA